VNRGIESARTQPIREVELDGGRGKSCRPFLRIEKDDEAFAACNALADEIGPLNDPKKIAEFLFEYLGRTNEEVFGVLTLDIHGRLKGYTETGRGEASSVMAPMLPTLRAAIMSGGGGSVLWHCHPSGVKAEPSEADDETTEAFADAFETVGMPFIDHVIVAGSSRKLSYYSYFEDGRL
jgi:DNA repair protein RadC